MPTPTVISAPAIQSDGSCSKRVISFVIFAVIICALVANFFCLRGRQEPPKKIQPVDVNVEELLSKSPESPPDVVDSVEPSNFGPHYNDIEESLIADNEGQMEQSQIPENRISLYSEYDWSDHVAEIDRLVEKKRKVLDRLNTKPEKRKKKEEQQTSSKSQSNKFEEYILLSVCGIFVIFFACIMCWVISNIFASIRRCASNCKKDSEEVISSGATVSAVNIGGDIP